MILGGGPNRIGQGIEFDYCCCQAAFALQGRRLRGDHGQLEPRDGQHRLRHLRPAVLRAADGRGRAQHLRADRADGGDRAVRRADAAEPGPGAGGGRRADHRHQPRDDRPGRGPRAVPPGDRAARAAAAAQRLGHPIAQRRGGSPNGSAIRCSSGPASCWAAAPWRSSTTSPASTAT